MSCEIRVFSDGACSGNPGPGGWGTLLGVVRDGRLDGDVAELGGGEPATTNNRMEMKAALEGLRYANAMRGDFSRTLMLTDSKFVIDGASKWMHGWKRNGWLKADKQPVLNQDLWRELDEAIRQSPRPLVWHYVPGHAGVPGNERVDEIAVAYSKKESVSLYAGAASAYDMPERLLSLPASGDAPAKKKSSKSSGGGKTLYYLSYLDGRAEKHATWPECEARVKGKSGARFKKVTTEAEATALVAEWAKKNRSS